MQYQSSAVLALKKETKEGLVSFGAATCFLDSSDDSVGQSFGTDIHSLQRRNVNDIGNPLPFYPAPSSAQNLSLYLVQVSKSMLIRLTKIAS